MPRRLCHVIMDFDTLKIVNYRKFHLFKY